MTLLVMLLVMVTHHKAATSVKAMRGTAAVVCLMLHHLLLIVALRHLRVGTRVDGVLLHHIAAWLVIVGLWLLGIGRCLVVGVVVGRLVVFESAFLSASWSYITS